MIEGVSHITFIVQNLEKSAKFLGDIFGAEEIYSSGDRTFSVAREKFFLIHRTWIVLMEGDAIARSYNHVAFKIPDNEFETYRQRVLQTGVDVKEPRPRVEGEGISLYFYDYDNHLFELHTGTLEQRLKSYAEKTAA